MNENEIGTSESVVDFSYFENNDVVLTSEAVGVPRVVDSAEMVPTKRKRKKKETELVNGSTIDTGSSATEEVTVLDAYEDNMNALRATVMEYEMLAGEFKADLDQIRASRTLKGRYHYASEIGQTLNSILSNKVAAIKELNATIKNAKEYDYKVAKDRQASMEANDDKHIMDMYNAFIGAPVPNAGNRSMLGPTDYQTTMYGVVPQSMGPDVGYDNYIRNLTPEQNMMLYENNPDVKQVVTYNAATGEKHFAVMNVKTGQEIPNAAHHDDMFLEGVTIDPRRGIARNTNLNESYPLIVLNDDNSTNGF